MNTNASNLEWELRRHALFKQLAEPEIVTLARSARMSLCRPREALFLEGDPGGSLFIVLSGRLKIATYSAEGKECVLSFAGPGEILGEITLLDGGPRTASAYALQPTRTAELARKDFLPILERNPKAAMEIISVLCGRLRATSQHLEDATFLSAAPRLARSLLRVLESQGTTTADGAEVLRMRLSQGTLGAYAGLMRESVNRLVRVWEESGIVSFSNEEIVLHKKDELERIALLY